MPINSSRYKDYSFLVGKANETETQMYNLLQYAVGKNKSG